MRIQPVIWTWSEHGPAAIECVERCIECGFMAPIVVDDSNNPMREEVVRYLQKAGATVRSTSWKRNRNLLGLANFLGMRIVYSDVFSLGRADCILRLDADVLVTDPAKVRAAADPSRVVGQVVPDHGLIGGCHLIGRNAKLGISDAAARAQECQHMGRAAMDCLTARTDWLAAQPLTETPEKGRLMAWAAVEFGRLGQLTGRICERREQAAISMSKARAVLLQ